MMDRTTIFIILVLILCFITLGVKSYQIGFYKGMDTICDKDLGIDQNGEFICYDRKIFLSKEMKRTSLMIFRRKIIMVLSMM